MIQSLKNTKKFVAVAAFVFAFAFAFTASAAFDFGSATLKRGSSVQYVSNMQLALNSCTGSGLQADGKFGPNTENVVKSFQASKNLTADGLVGNMTKNALNSCGGSTGGLPAGCTSTSGFSTVNGQSCATGGSMPAGCMPGFMFSPTTGQSCTGSSTGPVTGGAGSAILSSTSVDVESEVMEGDTEKVHGFRVEAQDSDIQVTNLRVTIENNNYPTSTRRPDRVLREVSVWMGNTKVGSIDPADMTRESGNVYSRNVSLSNAVVRKGSANRQNFYIGFTALNNIDSADMPGNWGVGVSDIRTVDGSGAIMTSSYDTIANSSPFGPDSFGIEFTDTASAGDIKMRISTGSNNPIAGNVEVSDTTSTSDVTMLEFRLKAEGTDMIFDSLAVTLTGTNATPQEIASELRLMRGSTTLADLTGTDVGTNGTKNFNLYDDFTIEEGDTETFRVVAKINKIDVGNFGQGDSLRVDFNGVSVEDKNGNSMTNFTGSAPGETQTFYSEGLIFTKKSGWTVSTTTDTSGDITSATYTMKVGVTAFGNTFYVGQQVQAATTGSSTNAFAYWIENSSAPATEVIGGTKTATVQSNAPVQGSSWRLDEGQEREFTITVNLLDPVGAPGSFRVQLGSMRTFTDSGLSQNSANRTLNPATDFETNYQLINS